MNISNYNNNFHNVSKQPLWQKELISFLIAGTLGVLFHFLYDLSGGNILAGFFFPVNESTWEHLKLVFFPILLVSSVDYIIGSKKEECYACIKFQSALLGMATIVILFYTYSGILGNNYDWLNITIYFIGMAVAYLYSYYKQVPASSVSYPFANRSSQNTAYNSTLCILGASALIIMFMIFSLYPPNIGLFQAPPTT